MSDLPILPPRPEDGHKGTFGTVCVLGGQAASPRVMIGGPALAALGALRAGAGLAVLAVPRPIVASALVIAPSATALALPVDAAKQLKPSEVAKLLDAQMSQYSCMAIGPGLGDGEPQQQVVLRMIAQDELPLVIDADALNCLAEMREFFHDLRAPAVLTPHPGEFRRIARALQLDIDPTNDDTRIEAASTLAQRLGCVVVLKGHRTVISDGVKTEINETGNVALATGGSGDVLTGMIAGLIAQHFVPHGPMGIARKGGLSLFDCARVAVHAHGTAADRWAQQHGTCGMLATDLLSAIPDALHQFHTQE